MKILKLPTEIYIQIFSYLDYDLIKFYEIKYFKSFIEVYGNEISNLILKRHKFKYKKENVYEILENLTNANNSFNFELKYLHISFNNNDYSDYSDCYSSMSYDSSEDYESNNYENLKNKLLKFAIKFNSKILMIFLIENRPIDISDNVRSIFDEIGVTDEYLYHSIMDVIWFRYRYRLKIN